uniref:Capsid n=1 Tax=Picoa juniperi partitivirus 4 TaxID=2778515 RepID=A0A7L8Y8T9_9VIRU|nr:capsid [Picoa juniperi partitivirus 4]
MADTNDAPQLDNAPERTPDVPIPRTTAEQPPNPQQRVPTRHTGLRPRANPPQQQATGLPALLAIVADQGRYTRTFDEQNAYIPSSHSLMRVVDEMDQQMRTTKRFTDNNPIWHPIISQTYFGLIFIIQTMRSQQANGLLPIVETEFLTWFENNFGFNTIAVPGPIRPILAALAACPAPLPNYGNTSPRLPRTCSATSHNRYLLLHGHAHLIPPIPAYIDQLRAFCNQTGNAPTAQFNWYSNFYGRNYDGSSRDRILAIAPGISTNSTFVPLSVQTAFFDNRSQLANALPPRRGTGLTHDFIPWTEYFCFSQNNGMTTAWFPIILRIMSNYCRHFNGSCSLLSIPLVAHSVPMNIYTWTRQSNIGNNPQTGLTDATTVMTPRNLHSLECIGRCHDIDADIVSNQFSDVATLNTSYDNLPASTHSDYPVNGVIRFGEIWSTPQTFGTPTLNLQPPLGAVIASHYHSSTALNAQ